MNNAYYTVLYCRMTVHNKSKTKETKSTGHLFPGMLVLPKSSQTLCIRHSSLFINTFELDFKLKFFLLVVMVFLSVDVIFPVYFL